MKYRDIIALFMAPAFILTLAYVIGVNTSLWFIPTILLLLLIIIIYKLWIEK